MDDLLKGLFGAAVTALGLTAKRRVAEEPTVVIDCEGKPVPAPRNVVCDADWEPCHMRPDEKSH